MAMSNVHLSVCGSFDTMCVEYAPFCRKTNDATKCQNTHIENHFFFLNGISVQTDADKSNILITTNTNRNREEKRNVSEFR